MVPQSLTCSVSGQCEAGSAVGHVSQEEQEACLGSCLQPLPGWFLQRGHPLTDG